MGIAIMEEESRRSIIEVPDAPPVPGLAFRGFRGREDFGVMADVFDRSREVDDFTWPSDAGTFETEYTNMANFDISSDLVFAQVDGCPVGYGRVKWYDDVDGIVVHDHYVLVVPEWRGKGIQRCLLRWVDTKARETAIGRPGDPRRVLRSWSMETEGERRRALEVEGHVVERHFYEMLRDLTEPIPDVPLPSGLEVRPIGPDGARKVLEAQWTAAMDHWGAKAPEEEDYQRFMGLPLFQPELWTVAWDGDEVAGAVIAWILAEDNERMGRKWGFPDEIAVVRPYRRRGLARALLARSLRMLRERGMEHANLGVDVDNPRRALRLYESLGFTVYRTHMVYRKDLEARR